MRWRFLFFKFCFIVAQSVLNLSLRFLSSLSEVLKCLLIMHKIDCEILNGRIEGKLLYTREHATIFELFLLFFCFLLTDFLR